MQPRNTFFPFSRSATRVARCEEEYNIFNQVILHKDIYHLWGSARFEIYLTWILSTPTRTSFVCMCV